MPEAGARGAAATPWEIDGRQGRAEPALGSRATRRNSDGSSTQASPSARTHAAVPTADGSQGVLHLEDDDHDGPQGHRRDVHRHVVRLLHGRRPDGDADAGRAGPARACSSCPRSSTTSCSRCTARSCCCSTRRRSCSVSRTWCCRCRSARPDVAFPRLNAFSYWLYLFGAHHRHLRVPHPGRCRRLRLDGLHAAVDVDQLARASARTCGSWAWPCPAWAPSSAAST